MSFSVRETVSFDRGMSDSELESRLPGLSRTYTAIDLQVHMTRYWQYRKLYGPMADTVEHFIERMDDGFPEHVVSHLVSNLADPGALVQARETLVRILEKAREVDAAIAAGNTPPDLASAQPGHPARLELRTLFEHKFPDRSLPVGSILDEWVTLSGLMPGYMHLEWVAIQQNPSEPVVSVADMDAALAALGKFSPADPYLLSAAENPAFVVALRDAARKGILIRPIPTGTAPGLLDKHGTNDAKCINGICTLGYPQSWCNGTAGGACTAASLC
ncbi:MAG: hypothetical protein RLZZ303_3149 [Candidatus Hydrogenedentota bacterium]|jgi:hypothetical protein